MIRTGHSKLEPDSVQWGQLNSLCFNVKGGFNVNGQNKYTHDHIRLLDWKFLEVSNIIAHYTSLAPRQVISYAGDYMKAVNTLGKTVWKPTAIT